MKETVRELTPKFEKRQSYYGKALLKQKYNMLTLVSYDTEIIKINLSTYKLETLCGPEDLSNTTLRHLREFLKQNELGHIAELTKKEIQENIFKKRG